MYVGVVLEILEVCACSDGLGISQASGASHLEVLDTTNSMVRDARLTKAREAVQALLSALNELDAATFIAFADTAAASADGRAFHCACRWVRDDLRTQYRM